MAKNQEMAQKLNQWGIEYLAEVQKGYGLTPDTRSDRQVEAKALKKLRNPSRAKLLELYL